MAAKVRVGSVSATLPLRLDYDAAAEAISNHLFPVSRRQVQRMLSDLPRNYVGRAPLFETEAVLNRARQLLENAPATPGSVPIARKGRSLA
jgi:hypothetical protein